MMFSVRSLALLLVALTVASTSFVRAAAPASTFVAADDPGFVYEGRFDQANPAAPVVVWQASRIRVAFEGDSIALQFADAKGQSFFNAQVDGRTQLVALREGRPAEGTSLSGLGAGRHELVLFKRSEASAGTVRFRGVELPSDARLLPSERPSYRLRMQFFGDSITAGACSEDGAADQWADRSTHNNVVSYGALTAAAFQADYRNIAVSGMGIAIGWTEVKAGQMWDRIYPSADSPRADVASWVPDVLFINLGENDDSFSTAKHRPFPVDDYVNGYVALVQSFRRAWPDVQIVILRGGMFGGSQSEQLRKPWEKAVAQIEATDPHVSHFVFTHWASTHPRVADHRAMADELIAWLREQPFMKPAAIR
ncbi:SGNH/GDSL hydrolase family protein [Opitutus terrae]|uniref:Lipolytic protein G-D-S-L family n=1 Tax=Opitutus terrae (strain DSM 11246 / JCM 15787 / PB90-1) TaxID=452637 RepID=B1ZPB0_OPITP|nr:SGNH/GDSL hydrolase family protein [Opitutus terrae]ACB77599.1 lipolytic protein G-D-S-L family [Opitutus terrae PB90-1]